jgi:hypothetical protein
MLQVMLAKIFQHCELKTLLARLDKRVGDEQRGANERHALCVVCVQHTNKFVASFIPKQQTRNEQQQQ